MKKKYKSFIVLLLSAFAGGCTSALLIKSEPTGATVSVLSRNGTKKEIGKTPFELSYGELEKIMPGSSASGQMIPVSFEKENYIPQTLMVPAIRLGVSYATLIANLKQTDQEEYSADRLLQFLHNAQKFAAAGDFQRAHQEVDKAMEKNPKFIRAMSMKAAIYYSQNKWDDSISWYEKALVLDSRFEESVRMISEIKQKKRNVK